MGDSLQSASAVRVREVHVSAGRCGPFRGGGGPQARVMERPGANTAGVRRAGGGPQGCVRSIEMTSVGPQQSARSEMIDPPHAPFLPRLQRVMNCRFWL